MNPNQRLLLFFSWHYWLFSGLIFVKRTSLTWVKTVNSGTTVSLLCSNILTEPSYIAWFKQINGSLPLCIVTQYVSKTQADSKYFNGFKKNHMEMSVNETLSSLRIVNVDVSDSGTFYCGSFLTNYMMFHNKTQLVVVNGNTRVFISFIYSKMIHNHHSYSVNNTYFVFFFYLQRD